MTQRNALARRDAEVLSPPGVDPLGDTVIQHTQSQALLLADDDHTQLSAADRGLAAFLEAQLLDRKTQQKELQLMLQEDNTGENETLKRLRAMQCQAATAAQRLSTVGYDRLRDLHAGGMLLSDIARDLFVNFNDLLAFMRQFPNAEQHAVEDAESCADAQTAQLLHDIENQKKPNQSTVDLMKIRSNVQLEMNKRLSGKWAQRKEDDRATTINNQSQFNVYLNAGGKQVPYDPQAPTKVIEKAAYHGAPPESHEPEVVSSEPDRAAMPPEMNNAQQVHAAFSDQGVSLTIGNPRPSVPAASAPRPRRSLNGYPAEMVDEAHDKVTPPTVHPIAHPSER